MVDSQISGAQNGWFTAMGILKEKLLSKDDDFRHRHVVGPPMEYRVAIPRKKWNIPV